MLLWQKKRAGILSGLCVGKRSRICYELMAFPCSPSLQLQSILHLTSWHLSSAWMCCNTCTLAGKLIGRDQAPCQVTVCLPLAGNKRGLIWSNSLLFGDQVRASGIDISHQLRYCTPKLQNYHRPVDVMTWLTFDLASGPLVKTAGLDPENALGTKLPKRNL